MDHDRFEQWTRAVVDASTPRRGWLRFVLAGGVAALAFGGKREDALACRRNGKPCDNKQRRGGGCCSGTCRQGKCRPTPGAAGCTVRQHFCNNVVAACPKKRTGACIVLDNGKPFCFIGSICVRCASNADCTEPSNGIPGKCIKKNCPQACSETDNRVCVYSQVVPPE